MAYYKIPAETDETTTTPDVDQPPCCLTCDHLYPAYWVKEPNGIYVRIALGTPRPNAAVNDGDSREVMETDGRVGVCRQSPPHPKHGFPMVAFSTHCGQYRPGWTHPDIDERLKRDKAVAVGKSEPAE